MTKESVGQRIGYLRVSSHDQNIKRQLDGFSLDQTFIDKASGKDINRPQLQAAIKHAREGDTFLVHSMDRLARSSEDMQRIVRELMAKGVSVKFVKERLTFTAGTNNPIDELMFTMLAAFAQFERSLIRERQREGIAIAKAKGNVYLGRKPALNAEQISSLHVRVLNGEKKTAIARELGISRETLYQYLRTKLEVAVKD